MAVEILEGIRRVSPHGGGKRNRRKDPEDQYQPSEPADKERPRSNRPLDRRVPLHRHTEETMAKAAAIKAGGGMAAVQELTDTLAKARRMDFYPTLERCIADWMLRLKSETCMIPLNYLLWLYTKCEAHSTKALMARKNGLALILQDSIYKIFAHPNFKGIRKNISRAIYPVSLKLYDMIKSRNPVTNPYFEDINGLILTLCIALSQVPPAEVDTIIYSVIAPLPIIRAVCKSGIKEPDNSPWKFRATTTHKLTLTSVMLFAAVPPGFALMLVDSLFRGAYPLYKVGVVNWSKITFAGKILSPIILTGLVGNTDYETSSALISGSYLW
jgi:hypothetical protein